MQVYAGLLLLVISDITVVHGVLSGRLLRARHPVLVVERVHTVHVGRHVRGLGLLIREQLTINQGLSFTRFLLLCLQTMLFLLKRRRSITLVREAVRV